jgi:hypothetical protein
MWESLGTVLVGESWSPISIPVWTGWLKLTSTGSGENGKALTALVNGSNPTTFFNIQTLYKNPSPLILLILIPPSFTAPGIAFKRLWPPLGSTWDITVEVWAGEDTPP